MPETMDYGTNCRANNIDGKLYVGRGLFNGICSVAVKRDFCESDIFFSRYVEDIPNNALPA